MAGVESVFPPLSSLCPVKREGRMLCECWRLRPPDKYRCFPAWLYPLPAQLRARVTLSEKAQLSGGRVYPPVRSEMAKESRWSHVWACLEEITHAWTRCTLHSCLLAQPSLLSKGFCPRFRKNFGVSGKLLRRIVVYMRGLGCVHPLCCLQPC